MRSVAEVNDDVERFRALIRVPTVSYADEAAIEIAHFEEFVDLLATSFPLLHEHLTLTRILEHSLLFRWQGRSEADPVVLMAHIDVVPIDESAPGSTRPSAPRSTTARSGVAARSTTRVARRHLHGRRAPARRRFRPASRRVAVLRGARGGLRAGRTRCRRGAPLARGLALVRAGRGWCDRAPGLPRGAAAAGCGRRLGEGHHHHRAARRGTGRALVDAGSGRADREDRARRRTPGEAAVRRLAARADDRDVRPDGAARARAVAAAVRPRTAVSSRSSSGRSWPPAPNPPPWCVRRWPSPPSPARPRTT